MQLPLNQIIHADCLDFMKTLPDKCIDLVLTDPPYGIEWKPSTLFGKSTPQTRALKDLQKWDNRPPCEYFDEIKRVGKEYIIWGGNYFADYLGACKEPLVWDKKTGANYFADGEMAFTSFQGTLRIFPHQWCGAFKDSERGIQNVHPTQKPIELMMWCLSRYSTESDIILDPFAGSCTTAVACINLKRNYICVEKEKKYVDIGRARVDAMTKPLF